MTVTDGDRPAEEFHLIGSSTCGAYANQTSVQSGRQQTFTRSQVWRVQESPLRFDQEYVRKSNSIGSSHLYAGLCMWKRKQQLC